MAEKTVIAADFEVCVKTFNEYLDSAWGMLQDGVAEVKECVLYMQKTEWPSDVDEEIRKVMHRVKEVYGILFKECDKIRHVIEKCRNMLECFQIDFLSKQMSVNLVLWQHHLERYELLFQTEGIEHISEILDSDLTKVTEMHFKPNMEKGDFKKLMKEIEKAELAKCYIENIMEGDLAELSDQCDFSSENVTSQLTKLLQEIEAVRQNCIGYLQSKQSTCNAIGKVLTALSFLGGAVFWCSIRLPMVPALVVGAVGAVVYLGAEKGLEIVHNEGEKINRKIYDVQSTMFNLEDAPKHEIISWKYLITKFKELSTLLREGVVKVREEDIYDINSLFKDAEKSLNNFRRHVDEFALDVKRVIDDQC